MTIEYNGSLIKQDEKVFQVFTNGKLKAVADTIESAKWYIDNP